MLALEVNKKENKTELRSILQEFKKKLISILKFKMIFENKNFNLIVRDNKEIVNYYNDS